MSQYACYPKSELAFENIETVGIALFLSLQKRQPKRITTFNESVLSFTGPELMMMMMMIIYRPAGTCKARDPAIPNEDKGRQGVNPGFLAIYVHKTTAH